MAVEHAPAICGSEGKDLPVGNHEDNLRPRDAPRMVCKSKWFAALSLSLSVGGNCVSAHNLDWRFRFFDQNDGGIFFLIEDAIEETLLTVAVSSLSNRELRIVMLYP